MDADDDDDDDDDCDLSMKGHSSSHNVTAVFTGMTNHPGWGNAYGRITKFSGASVTTKSRHPILYLHHPCAYAVHFDIYIPRAGAERRLEVGSSLGRVVLGYCTMMQ